MTLPNTAIGGLICSAVVIIVLLAAGVKLYDIIAFIVGSLGMGALLFALLCVPAEWRTIAAGLALAISAALFAAWVNFRAWLRGQASWYGWRETETKAAKVVTTADKFFSKLGGE